MPDAENIFKTGDVIGGEYEVLGTLGKGGFGIVFLVRDQQTRHGYALKTFRDEFLADAGARDSFQKEALVWINLGEHPFILEAQWVKAFSGRLFVAMDYVQPDASGRVSLFDYLQWREPIPPEQVTRRMGNSVLPGNGARQCSWRELSPGHQAGQHPHLGTSPED